MRPETAYKTYANQAVTAEQENRFLDASRHWMDAQRHTLVPKAIEYCQHRIDFCERQHFRQRTMLMAQEDKR